MASTDPRVGYALSVLLDRELSAPRPEWLAYATPNDCSLDRGVCIVPSGFFAGGYGTPRSIPALPLAQWQGIPVLYGRPRTHRQGDVIFLEADLIASAYFLLTRYEEWVRRDVRDAHGRFPGRESLPSRAGFLDRPVVDEYGRALRRLAADLGIAIPGNHREFSVLLTHDMDEVGTQRKPRQGLRSLAAALLGLRPRRPALHSALGHLGLAQHPFNNLDELSEFDAVLKRAAPDRVRVVYFFMAGMTGPMDNTEPIECSSVRSVALRARQMGAEIGLHASYAAGQTPEKIGEERRRVEHATALPVHHNRHHYLTWREPEDGAALAAAGIDWDSSLGYADQAGFRLGVCRPIPLFNPARAEPLGIEEHPLMVMDATLSGPNYMNLDFTAAREFARRLAHRVAEHRGELVLLWHNTELSSAAYGYHRRLYPAVLADLAELLQQTIAPAAF